MKRTALIAGITGIGGNHVARELLANGWDVIGLSRRPPQGLPSVYHVAADLLDPTALAIALENVTPTPFSSPLGCARTRKQRISGSTQRWYPHRLSRPSVSSLSEDRAIQMVAQNDIALD